MKVKINGCTLARDNHALRNARKYRNASRNNERERHMYSASYMNLIDKELIKDRERRERGVGGGGGGGLEETATLYYFTMVPLRAV